MTQRRCSLVPVYTNSVTFGSRETALQPHAEVSRFQCAHVPGVRVTELPRAHRRATARTRHPVAGGHGRGGTFLLSSAGNSPWKEKHQDVAPAVG